MATPTTAQPPLTVPASADPKLVLVVAWNLMSSGRLDEADDMLRKSPQLQGSSKALDLLALIALKKGDAGRARTLWQAVLTKDPENRHAEIALTMLDKSSTPSKLPQRALFATVGVAILCAVFFGFGRVKQKPAVIEASIHPVTIARTEHRSLVPSTTTTPTRKQFQVKGWTDTAEGTQTRLTYPTGLFAFRDHLSAVGKVALASLSNALKANSRDYWVLVEGHADKDPMPSRARYKDNYDLALHRAMIVARQLRTAQACPFGNLAVSSVGSSLGVTNGNDRSAKMKNRTVVIRLIPKT